tara:strand:- start:2916 stop:3449 length:534 start_codon:yes stop_codon:yes gene_type:complete
MNVFVIFAPGLGGNHLANLIATDPRYHPRATVAQYQTTKKYAHHSSHSNLTDIKIESYDNNVLCGHFGELYWLDRSLFKHKQVVIIEIPKDKNSFAYKRFQKFNNLNTYLFEEQRSLYTPGVIESVAGISDFYTIPAESVVNETSPVDLLLDMNYNIDKKICEQMHTEWIKNNLSLV